MPGPTKIAATAGAPVNFGHVYTLQSAVAANSDGDELTVVGMGVVRADFTATGVATVTWEGTEDDETAASTTWESLRAINTSTGAVDTVTGVSGQYLIPVAGLVRFRARIAHTSGASTVYAMALPYFLPPLPPTLENVEGTSYLSNGLPASAPVLFDPVGSLSRMLRFLAASDTLTNLQIGPGAPLIALNADGTTYGRGRLDAASNFQVGLGTEIAGEDTENDRLMTTPKDATFNQVHNPAAATQATITQAAGGGTVRNVCTGIAASIGAAATASGVVKVHLRDGAAGAGPILWSYTFSVPANSSAGIALTGLNIKGSQNTAMTLEFSAAGAANTEESVALTGYTLVS